MKQHITIDQLNELSEKGKERLHVHVGIGPYSGIDSLEKYLDVVLLSIGEMIEFLVSKGKNFSMNYDRNPDMWTFINGKWWPNSKGETKAGEDYLKIADALWSACVEVLEREE
jgi:hypothetical protein